MGRFTLIIARLSHERVLYDRVLACSCANVLDFDIIVAAARAAWMGLDTSETAAFART